MRVAALSDPLEGYAFQGMTFPALIPALLSAGGRERPFLALAAWDAAEAPAGLLLARRAEPCELLSILTRRDLRRRGLAARLLEEAARVLAAEGRRRVEATLERGRPMRDAAEALLKKEGWDGFSRVALMCRFVGSGKVLKAPWLRRLRVPAAFELFPWSELRSSERAAIEDGYRAGKLPCNLYPFHGEPWLEPGNSLGLRYKGEVVAWQVNHRPLPRLLRYTYTWVREDLRGLGIAAALVAESIRRHLDGPLARETDGATFKVPAEYEAMTRFVDRRWRGCVDEINEVVRCGKTLI